MFHLRKISNAVLLPLILSAVVNHARATTSGETNEPPTPSADEQKAVYLTGLTDVKPGTDGVLVLSSSEVRFKSKDVNGAIPIAQITSVAKGDERAERGGTAGEIVRNLANYHGSNMVLGLAMQKKIDLLSFEYHDETGGLHGAVFVLPKGTASALEKRLSAQVVPHPQPPAVACTTDQAKPDSIQIDPIEASGIEVPAEYRLLLYERLFANLQKQLPTYKLLRAGDVAAGPGCMAYSLHIALKGFKKGNESLRASTGPIGMFAGITSLSYQFALKDTSGAVALEKELKQSQRGDKESLNLTHSIAKNIAKRINKGIKPKSSELNK